MFSVFLSLFFLLVFVVGCIRSCGKAGMVLMEIRRNNEDGDNDRGGRIGGPCILSSVFFPTLFAGNWEAVVG